MKKLFLLPIALFLFGTTAAWAVDPPIYINSNGIPARVVAGDLNGDLIQDIAWITSNTSLLYTMLGDGDGGFNTPRTVAVPATNLTSLDIGDLNEDGKLDIAVAAAPGVFDNVLVIYFGVGDGSMAFNQAFPSSNGISDIIFADFDPSAFPFPFGTSHLDIAAAFTTNPGVQVLFGDGAGNYSIGSFMATGGAGPVYLDAAALPGPFLIFLRRRANLIATNSGTGNVQVFISNGDQTFQAGVPIGSGLDKGVAWGDINGDGPLDIAAGRSGTGVRVYFGSDSSGTAYGPGVNLTSSAVHYTDVCRGDFNGDGLADLVAVSDATIPVSRGLVTFFPNNGAGGFQAGINDTTLLPLSSCETGDINRNGFPDLLVGALTSSGRDSVLIYSLRAPILNPNLSSLGTPSAGTNFFLPSGTATDSSLVDSIKLLYRQMGKTSFDTLRLILGSGTKTRSFGGATGGFIPASAMTDRGLEYALLASDGFITERQPRGSAFYRLRTSVNENAPPTASGIYQLISFPFAVNPATAQAQIADNITDLGDPNVARLFWWDPVKADTISTDTSSLRGYWEYNEAGFPQFLPGRSMFLGTTSPKTYNGTGLSTLPDTLGIASEHVRLVIDSGWNMVASPYPYSVMFDSTSIILSDSSIHNLDQVRTDSISRGSVLWTRNAQNIYVTDSVFRPWKGYFLKSNARQKLVLIFPKGDYGLPATAPPAPGVVAAGTGWNLEVTAQSGDRLATPASLGISSGAERGRDPLDVEFPPPLAGDLRLVFQKGKEFGSPGDYISDFRPPSTESETWSFTVQPGGTRAIELNFGGLAEVPADYDLILSDKEGRARQNLRTEPTYRFIATNDRHFELAVAPKTTGPTVLVPTRYELYQNLPNPFNPQTLIKYDLPAAANVRLEVFNILGQKVATLVDRYEAAGPKSALWDGTDVAGNKVSSGIYLYKITAEDYVATKKMMLVK